MRSIHETLHVGDLFSKIGFPCPFLISSVTEDGCIQGLIMANLAISIYRQDRLLHRNIPTHSPGHPAGRVPTATPAGPVCILTIPITPGLETGDYLQCYEDDPRSWKVITAINEADGLAEITATVMPQPIYHFDQTTGLTERIQ